MKVLFVCTGNTCRSPMAEAIARSLLPKDRLNIFFDSAGTYAFDGDDMSLPAKAALRELKIPFSKHKAQLLTTQIAEEADIILCMEQRHVETVLALSPKSRGKTFLISECAGSTGPVLDPFSKGLQVYLDCALQMKDYINTILNTLLNKEN